LLRDRGIGDLSGVQAVFLETWRHGREDAFSKAGKRVAIWDGAREEQSSAEPRYASGKEGSAVKQGDSLMPLPGRSGAQRLPIDREGR
jgi:hypothetical protein